MRRLSQATRQTSSLNLSVSLSLRIDDNFSEWWPLGAQEDFVQGVGVVEHYEMRLNGETRRMFVNTAPCTLSKCDRSKDHAPESTRHTGVASGLTRTSKHMSVCLTCAGSFTFVSEHKQFSPRDCLLYTLLRSPRFVCQCSSC